MTTFPDIDFQKLIESLPDAIIIINRKGRIIMISGRAELLFGYLRQELLSQPVEILIPVRFRTEHIRHLIRYYGNPSGHPIRKGVKLYGLRKDGQEFPADISLGPLEAGEELFVIASIRDISEQKKIEQALTVEKERLNFTLRSIGDGVITVDPEGRVFFLNKVAEILTGWSQSVAEGRPLREVFHILHEKDRNPYEDPVAMVLSTGKIVEIAGPTLLVSREGIERNIVDCAAPIRDQSGAIIGVILVFRDVTGKRRMEEELLKSMKLESVGLLAGGIAHDFNNLLSAIIGTVNLVKTSPDKERDQRLRTIERAAFRAKEIASQLLTFAKGTAPVKTVTSIRQLIEEGMGFAVLGAGCQCDMIYSDPLWMVEVDAGQIIQVIHNLVINASHAMPNGGVIAISAENITLKKKEAHHCSLNPGNYVKVSVKDSGIGIDKENLLRIFDPYFTTKEKGTGLGLSNSYAIIKKHHGTILAESRFGEGSTFSFYLPAVLGKTTHLSDTGEALHIRNQRVLILDDELMSRKTAGQILEQSGYDVGYAENSEEAINLYQSANESDEPFDAVLLDLNLTKENGGREILARLKKIDASVKAIVASRNLEDPVMADFKKFGFKGRLIKPYDPKKLAKVLHDLLHSI